MSKIAGLKVHLGEEGRRGEGEEEEPPGATREPCAVPLCVCVSGLLAPALRACVCECVCVWVARPDFPAFSNAGRPRQRASERERERGIGVCYTIQ